VFAVGNGEGGDVQYGSEEGDRCGQVGHGCGLGEVSVSIDAFLS